MDGGGRLTSRRLDAMDARCNSSPAAGDGDKCPPKQRTATAAESQPDDERTVAGSLVEIAPTGTAAEMTAPRAWEQHAARSRVVGGGGHLSGGSGAARIQPDDGGAVAPRSCSAQPAVRLPVLGSEALPQRPGRMSGAVGQSEVSRCLSFRIVWFIK